MNVYTIASMTNVYYLGIIRNEAGNLGLEENIVPPDPRDPHSEVSEPVGLLELLHRQSGWIGLNDNHVR